MATAISSTFTALPYTTKAMTEKNGVIYVTNKDVKNGKVIITNKTAKSIVITKSVKKATIRLKGVKLLNGLTVEKGDYVLKTARTKIKNLKISGKDTNIKLDKSSDLNKRNFVLKIAKNTTGNLDLSELGKKVTTELGKNSDVNIKVGNNDKASIVVKKSSTTSKLELTGANEDASISKIRVESPIKLTVKVNALTLETAKKADKAEITMENNVSEVKNEAGALVFDKEAERQKAEKEKEDKEREEKAKEDKAKEEKLKEDKAKEAAKTGNTGGGYSGGGTSTPSKPEKKTVSITLTKDGDIEADGGKTKVKVTYNPADATDKNLEWTIKEGEGIAKIISSSANEAEIEALADGKCKIEARIKGSSIKAEVEIVVRNQVSKALENRIKDYLTYNTDNLNKDNYEDVLKRSDDLSKDIENKISAGKDKEKWEEYKKRVEAKIDELAAKIKMLKEAENEAARFIEAEYNAIDKNFKLEPAIVKEAVEKIEAKRKEVSEKVFKAKVINEAKYNAIKTEVEDYKKIASGNKPVIGDDGVASFNALPVSAKYELVKVGSSGNIESKELKAGDNQINLLKQMRKSGVGEYTVRLFKEFTYLKDVEIGISDKKEVKLLEKVWGDKDINAADYNPPYYEYDGEKFNLKVGRTNTIRLEKENGKWMLKWDEVKNATTYDIIAELSFGNYTGDLGSYNLTSTADNYENIENEFEYEPLDVLADKINENKNASKRTMVAVNHTSNSIEFDKFIPVKGNNIGTGFWSEKKEDPAAIDIWIIPRNKNSLYISNMKEYFLETKTEKNKRNKFYIDGGEQSKFRIKDLYKMVYGK